MKVFVKAWFNGKVEIPGYCHRPSTISGEVVRETEKAVRISFETCTLDGERDMVVEAWVPKSCIESEEAHAAAEAAVEARFEAARNSYDALIAFCKENGVKGVRVGLRRETILNKVKAAGLVFNG